MTGVGRWAVRLAVLGGTTAIVVFECTKPVPKPQERMCRAQCECLLDSCSAERGFPFSDAATCMDWCQDLHPAERICLHRWCVAARDSDEHTDDPAIDHSDHIASLPADGFFDPVRLADAEPVTHYFHLCEHAWGAFGLDECNLLDR